LGHLIEFLDYSSDTAAELALIREEACAAGADAAVVSNHWAEGGAGARALAEAVVATCEGPSAFKFLYDLNLPIEEKISIICKEIYGADGMELSELARKQVDTYTRQGYSSLPSKHSNYLPFYSDILQTHALFHSLHGQDPILVLA
jgi:methylenetetrahydrofolate dehydrogenase (NADP+)/methenyltetrahydrofolate cyclohydrolase/formyltetrahydrofolate synthetase